MSVEFVDELPGSDRNAELRAFAAALRSNPGRWAKYPGESSSRSAYNRAYQVRKGSLAAFRDGTFEAAVREGVLYVQHVPES